MDPRGFGFDSPAAPQADAPAERRREGDARDTMRAAPPDREDKDATPRAEEPGDEPGYGHGV